MQKKANMVAGGVMLALLAGCSTANTADTNSASSAPMPKAMAETPAAVSTVVEGFESATPPQPGLAHPEKWPAYKYPWKPSEAMKSRVNAIVAKMTPEEKVGQIIQADLCCVKPDDAKKYHLGSILVGGNSGIKGDDFALAPEWLKEADAFYEASVDTSGGRAGVPIIWGIDAVHGHSNIIGATLFPHNIGLGAMRDSALIEKIGHATAKEIRVTGQEWTFAPTVTVPQDYRWGRAYEGYSSDPQLVASYVGAMLKGLQGAPDNENLLAQDRVIASTKHFLADGGTNGGVDQGEATISEKALRDIHGLPYGPAIEGGVSTVMVSYSSWQNEKMSGNKSLLTDVLKKRMDFQGFIVTDWNGHGQVKGCSNESCPPALAAGVDMFMAPDSWKGLYDNTLSQVKSGIIPMDRLDDAVRRVLMVKERIGLFTAGKPSVRPLSGQWELLGSKEHREISREAVRKSLVLLKNQGVLPLKPGMRLLVAGDAADDVSRQSGGWTLSWQGKDVPAKYFPGSTTLWKGLDNAVRAGGGTAELSADGSFKTKPDAAVVIFGEKSYAEFQGDRSSLQLDPELTGPFKTMKTLQAKGIPVVAVMVTGRPLYVNPALNAADAFVVAWLPGSEGQGLADVIVGESDGRPRYDFAGKLPTAWPRTALMKEGALFPFGYGLTYQSAKTAWSPLNENAGAANSGDSRVWFANGIPAASWSLLVSNADMSDETRINIVPATTLSGRMTVSATDYKVQEGARRFRLNGGTGMISLRNFDKQNISKELNAELSLILALKVSGKPDSASIGMDCDGPSCSGSVPIELSPGPGYSTYGVPLKCLAKKGVDMSHINFAFKLVMTGKADIEIGEVKLGSDPQNVVKCD